MVFGNGKPFLEFQRRLKVDERQGTIRTSDLLSVFLRSLLIQSSLSFDRMQSLGFAYAIMPALRRLYSDDEEYRRRMHTHLEYFNTQPYLAAFVLGAAIRLEEERASGRNPATDVQGMKNTLMAPLGALGDSFFWGSLKPLLIVIAVSLLLAGAWWAPLLFLAAYNCLHLSIRWRVMVWGYRSAGDLVSLMGRYPFTRMARRFKKLSLVALGTMLALIPVWRTEFKPVLSGPILINSGAGLAATLALAAALRKEGSPVKLMFGLAAVCLALAYAGVGK